VKRYRTIVADPPWNVKAGPSAFTTLKEGKRPNPRRVSGKSRNLPFPPMGVDAITAIPVAAMAARDAHLYIWTINAYITATYDIAHAWGFKPSALLTWCKAPMGHGLGGTYRNTTEFVLFCRRGSLSAKTEVPTSWFDWKRPYVNGDPVHSLKPDAFVDMVEQVSPGPYVELFARRARFGWDYWGNESLGTAEMPEAAA
jgi:N6-adenosine-specific RNA methylase IME4